MVPRVRPTLTRFPTNILFAPADSTLSYSTFKYVMSVGTEAVVIEASVNAEVSLTV